MSQRTSLLAASASAFALLATAPAFAQDNPDDVIIVSATKRNTTLQETPVAVTVTSADVIEKAQILDIKDLQSVVPTFRVSQLQNSANATLSIRGFGNGGNNIGIEPAVGLFIDGVYRSRAAAQIGDLPNLERIEVLSGPQSTLFGKNASAGVVSVVTAKPDFETNGYVEGGLGNFGQNYVKGYITGGLTDTLAVSLGGGYQKRDGYFEPAEGTAGGDFNNIDRFGIRAQALWEPTESFSARLILDQSTLNENCCGVATAVAGPTAPIIAALGGQIPTTDAFTFETSVNRPTENNIDDSGVSLQLDYDFNLLGGATLTSISSYRQNETGFDSDSDFTSLELLENTFQFVEIDTFTQELRLASNNSGPLAWMVGGYYFDEKIGQDSGFDFGADLRPFIDALSTEGGSLNPASTTPTPLSVIEATSGNAPGTFFGDQIQIDERFDQDNEAYSIFGTLDYDVTDRLTLTVGGNYTNDKKRVTASTVNNDVFSNIVLADNLGTLLLANGAIDAAAGDPENDISIAFTNLFVGSPAEGLVPFTAANLAALDTLTGMPGAEAQFRAGVRAGVIDGLSDLQFQPQFLSFPNAVESGRTDDDEFTYTLKAAYEINDNFNAYVSTATGFKASSFNLTRDSRPFLADGAALQTAGLLPNNFDPATGRNFGTRFSGPEEVQVFEAGLKARFDWGAFNVTVFDQTIDNFQSTIFQGTGFVLANAGEQSTQGIEFDSTITPVQGLTLGFAGILQDPTYDDFQNAPVVEGSDLDLADGVEDGSGDLSGFQPAGINEVSLSLSAQYEFALSKSIGAYVRGDWQYEDEVQVVDNITEVTRDTSIFNGSFGVSLDNGLDVRFWGRNLFNHESFISAFPGVIQDGTVSAYPNQPRTYGVSLRKNF